MAIIDVNAWTGHGLTHPVPGAAADVCAALTGVGVERICLAPLDAAWCHNPHAVNSVVYDAAAVHREVLATPVLDPTIATWEEELDRARGYGVRLTKLLPAYSGYDMAAAEPLLSGLAAAGLPVLVQVRLEDPRHHHPLARVPDVPAAQVAAMAAMHPELPVIIGGATSGAILALRDELAAVENLFADLSQADGMDAVRRMLEHGLQDKLLFGSHVPLFEPLAGLARILPELDDATAAALLGGNAARLLRLN